MKNKSKLITLSVFVTLTIIFFSFKQLKDVKIQIGKEVPNSCTATATLGASCSITCPVGKSPSCASGGVKVKCTCTPDEPTTTIPGGTLFLEPDHKYDVAISTSLGFGTTSGTLFANKLSNNKSAVISSNWTNYLSTIEEVKNVYYTILTPSERSEIDALFGPGGIIGY